MCSGNEFHAAGLTCEKARSPNWAYNVAAVTEKSVDDVDLRC